ncbi:uncharacterized protein GJ701_005303 [Geothlypis trichas]
MRNFLWKFSIRKCNSTHFKTATAGRKQDQKRTCRDLEQEAKETLLLGSTVPCEESIHSTGLINEPLQRSFTQRKKIQICMEESYQSRGFPVAVKTYFNNSFPNHKFTESKVTIHLVMKSKSLFTSKTNT